MPELSRFYGIIIAMYYDDHVPPHFHIRYGRQRAIMAVDNLMIIEGDVSPRVRGLVTEWAASHREALQEDWDLARQHLPLKSIPPLE